MYWHFKSALTVLGFTTKSSISTIKPNKLNELENEYAKMRSNKPDEMFARFPALKEMDFFSPGLRTIILELAAQFDLKPKDDLEKIDQKQPIATSKKGKYSFNSNERTEIKNLFCSQT